MAKKPTPKDEGGVDVWVVGNPFKLQARTIRDWLKSYTEDEDVLRVMHIDGGGIALQNKRTLTCYFSLPEDP